jgi:hypothetical protein
LNREAEAQGSIVSFLLSSTIKLTTSLRTVSNAYVRLASSLLPQQSESHSLRPGQPFAVLSPFLLIALYLPSSLSSPASPIYAFAASSLSEAEAWSSSTYHLPSAEEFLRSCWQVLSKATTDPDHKVKLVKAALCGRSIEVKREALEQLALLTEEEPAIVGRIQATLTSSLLDSQQAGDVRVAIAEILRLSTSTEGEKGSFTEVESLYRSTNDLPLREALMGVLAGLADSDEERDIVLEIIERWSRINEVSFRNLRDCITIALDKVSLMFQSSPSTHAKLQLSRSQPSARHSIRNDYRQYNSLASSTASFACCKTTIRRRGYSRTMQQGRTLSRARQSRQSCAPEEKA